MPDHKQVYKQEAQNYQRLIAREDYQENLLPAIRRLWTLKSGCDRPGLWNWTAGMFIDPSYQNNVCF